MTSRDDDKLTTADLASTPPRSDTEDVSRFMPPGDTHAVPAEEELIEEHAIEGETEALFPHDEVNQLRPKWTSIQTRFVDEPRRSVEEADSLVASTIKRLAESFANERANLEAQWARGGDVSTEDLRLALRRYRSFFDRLLSV